ncbi:hypothetical protein PoB_005867500 [Plakobranchus ocellatus]|uniref:Uncharacterized protein n=1 Tax=Plakobranchus ocellatus TaxID=259542 RepID=A0AAV4CH32_9GAST|nr:hypothetical protein PoB_005867500 [Plakobranchus ocellatus]
MTQAHFFDKLLSFEVAIERDDLVPAGDIDNAFGDDYAVDTLMRQTRLKHPVTQNTPHKREDSNTITRITGFFFEVSRRLQN